MNMTSSDENRKELALTRIFDAPRTLVFRAWTDPRLVAQWWGPKDFTNPVCELDARPGGAIFINMRGPDVVDFPMNGLFQEVKEPERLVFTSSAFTDDHGKDQLEVLNTVSFDEVNGKTKVTLHAKVLRMTPQTTAAVDGMDEGWSQSLERLNALVSKQ